MNPIRHYLIDAAGMTCADIDAREQKPAPLTLRRAETGAALRADEMRAIRDEILAWSLIAFAGIGLLAVCGYVIDVARRLA